MSLLKRAKRVLSPVLGRFCDLEIKSGSGHTLTLENGRVITDLASGIAVTSTGHCHPKVVQAIQKQAETLIHPCIGMGHYEPAIALAESLLKKVSTETPYQVFFTQSGSEAVETALKLAKYVSRRPNLIAYKGGFHGRTLGALSVTSKPKYREGYEPLLPGVTFIDYPDLYRAEGKSDSEKLESYLNTLNDPAIFNTDVAAVIIEPMLGEGGYIPAPKAYMKALEQTCRKHGILLIADEIQTGIARSGTWFLWQQLDISPDIITTAKGLASGMPLGGCIAKESIMSKWPPGAHGGTYGGNPVCCASGLATLQVLEDEISTIPSKAATASRFLTEQLGHTPTIGDIRVIGLLIGIECVTEDGSPNADEANRIRTQALEKDLLVITCGSHGHVIRLLPPLTMSENDIISSLQRLVEVIHDNH